MGLSSRLSSCSSVRHKKTIPTHEEDEPRKKQSFGTRNSSIRLRIHEMNPICKSRKKTATVFPVEEEDFDKQFWVEGWQDEDDGDDQSMWLSSGSASPSSCYDGYKYTNFLELSLDEWLISSLLNPFWGTTLSFFDGSRVNPIEEATLALKGNLDDEEEKLQEVLEEEETVSWLMESSFEQSSEDLTRSYDSSSSIYGHDSISPSRVWNTSQKDCWVSLVDLDAQDSTWISDNQSESDALPSDFPSPSYAGSVQSSSYIVTSCPEEDREKSKIEFFSSSDIVSEKNVEVEELRIDDEPIFWPSDGKCDWGSEATWDLFIMSPRKFNAGRPKNTSPHFIGFRFQNRKLEFKERCKRRLEFNSGLKSSKIFESTKPENGTKETKGVNRTPSRLRRSSGFSGKIVPVDMKADDVMEPREEKLFTEGSVCKYKNFFEEDFSSDKELPIETVSGLHEFDGHEGVDSAFNEDHFCLEESL